MELVYSRTKTIQEDKVSGFCPGCMHSTVVKLIGEALEEMNLVDKAVMVTEMCIRDRCKMLQDHREDRKPGWCESRK